MDHTYIDVEDADDVAGKVVAAGGTVLFGPTNVMTAGRMAIFSDTTGAVVAAWQSRDLIGAQLVNEPGALVWNELVSSDLAETKAFYAEAFGWGWGGSDEYAEAQVHGRTVAGVVPRGPDLPSEVPDTWAVYFGASDVEGDCRRAAGMGATVVVGPADVPGSGRFAMLLDPQGGAIGSYEA